MKTLVSNEIMTNHSYVNGLIASLRPNYSKLSKCN